MTDIDVDTLGKIKDEIEQIVEEERKHDEKWAAGLRYAIKIIDKYMQKVRNKDGKFQTIDTKF